MNLIAPDLFIQPLNHSVVYLKESYILTNDAWRVGKDLSTGTFKGVISAIKGDIIFAEKRTKVFTSISELRQIETLLNTFEASQFPTSFA
jgi:hypothetical protein